MLAAVRQYAGEDQIVVNGGDETRVPRRKDRRFGVSALCAVLAYDERFKSATGQTLRRTLTEWDQSGPQSGGSPTATRDPRVTRVTELILDAGGVTALAKTTRYEHDADLNVRLVTEHDFVSVSQSTALVGEIGSNQSAPPI